VDRATQPPHGRPRPPAHHPHDYVTTTTSGRNARRAARTRYRATPPKHRAPPPPPPQAPPHSAPTIPASWHCMSLYVLVALPWGALTRAGEHRQLFFPSAQRRATPAPTRLTRPSSSSNDQPPHDPHRTLTSRRGPPEASLSTHALRASTTTATSERPPTTTGLPLNFWAYLHRYTTCGTVPRVANHQRAGTTHMETDKLRPTRHSMALDCVQSARTPSARSPFPPHPPTPQTIPTTCWLALRCCLR